MIALELDESMFIYFTLTHPFIQSIILDTYTLLPNFLAYLCLVSIELSQDGSVVFLETLKRFLELLCRTDLRTE